MLSPVRTHVTPTTLRPVNHYSLYSKQGNGLKKDKITNARSQSYREQVIAKPGSETQLPLFSFPPLQDFLLAPAGISE